MPLTAQNDYMGGNCPFAHPLATPMYTGEDPVIKSS